jgi:beta-barrel assembly-enhancing protease
MIERMEKTVDRAIASPRSVKLMAFTVFILPIALVMWIIPTLASKLAPLLPQSFERALAQESLAYIKARSKESTLHPASAEYLRRKFEEMKVLAEVPEATLEFRSWIPNAVTLPGNTIIMCDELIKIVGATDGATAVLAHEIAHAKLRHASKKVFTGTALWSIVLPMISSDRSTGKIAGSTAELFIDSRYSRDLEREADAYAYELLARMGQRPITLSVALSSLESAKARTRSVSKTYASSHPSNEERHAAALAANERARKNGQIK